MSSKIFLHPCKFSKYHTSFLLAPGLCLFEVYPRGGGGGVAATLCCLQGLEAFSEDVNLVVNCVQSPVSEILPHPEASAVGNSTLAEMLACFLFSSAFIKTKIESLPCVCGVAC